MKPIRLLIISCLLILLFLTLTAQGAGDGEIPKGFHEDFSGPTLDPAWTVLSHLTPPTNTYSLTENPGYLRYKIRGSRIWDCWPRYALRPDGYKPCLVIFRPFRGKHWVLATKVTYDFSELNNGRQIFLHIVLKYDLENTGPYECGKITTINIGRDNDLDYWHRNNFGADVIEEGQYLGLYRQLMPWPGIDTWYVRIVRQDRLISVMLSRDGEIWFEAFPTVELSSDPGDLQTLTLEGGCSNAWNTCADYDYINVDPIVIPASLDFEPDTINLKSKGKWVTSYIEFPEGYDVEDIDIASLKINGVIPAEDSPVAVGDHDFDGVPDLMVKFSRSALKDVLSPGEAVEIVITGTAAGVDFEGRDTIRVF